MLHATMLCIKYFFHEEGLHPLWENEGLYLKNQIISHDVAMYG